LGGEQRLVLGHKSANEAKLASGETLEDEATLVGEAILENEAGWERISDNMRRTVRSAL